ncbi:hypothetical protein N9K77_00955 [bacterium]|nr:hypothetical protein [bacterium]
MQYAKNILETIGNTPLVRLNNITKGIQVGKALTRIFCRTTICVMMWLEEVLVIVKNRQLIQGNLSIALNKKIIDELKGAARNANPLYN